MRFLPFSVFVVCTLIHLHPSLVDAQTKPGSVGVEKSQSEVSRSDTQPDQKPTNWRDLRLALERQFGNELQQIAQWCRDNQLESQVQPTLDAYQNRDTGRQYIFLPSDLPMPKVTDDLSGRWQAKMNEANVAHANRIFKLATQASEQNEGAIAYQLLHEVIHYNRDQLAVRKMLAHVKTNDGWKVASDSLRIKPGTKPHDIVSWRAKNYIRVLTPHFEIESNASPARTKYLALELEKAHSVWRQVFFEYWSSSASLKRWINGAGAVRIPSKRFRVVFFNSNDSYKRELIPLVRGIGISTGYYSSKLEVSFFFDGDHEVQSTWRHELTHQLFRESRRARKDAFEKQFIWLDEGIATYFESMMDFGSYVTLGGFESRRLQYARVRRFMEDFHINMQQLSAISRTDLQQHGDIKRIYSEAAGLTDMLINDQNGAYEKRLTEFLKLIYKGRVKQGAFEKIIGKTFKEWDERYPEYLRVDSQLVESHLTRPELRTELSLPASQLKKDAFDSIGRCVNLNWLDLSKNQILSGDLAKLNSCKQLHQLILTQCTFESDSLNDLKQFPILDELDLSGSSVQDHHLVDVGQVPNLISLRLASTAITNEGLMQLTGLSRLRSLDVSRTRVTDRGIAALKSRLPNLKITQ